MVGRVMGSTLSSSYSLTDITWRREDVCFCTSEGVFKRKWRGGDFACLSLHWQVIKKKKQRCK
jgi:hypothetical protein